MEVRDPIGEGVPARPWAGAPLAVLRIPSPEDHASPRIARGIWYATIQTVLAPGRMRSAGRSRRRWLTRQGARERRRIGASALRPKDPRLLELVEEESDHALLVSRTSAGLPASGERFHAIAQARSGDRVANRCLCSVTIEPQLVGALTSAQCASFGARDQMPQPAREEACGVLLAFSVDGP